MREGAGAAEGEGGGGGDNGTSGGGDWKMCSNNVACVCRGMVFKSSPPIPSLSPHAAATAGADGHTTRARAVGATRRRSEGVNEWGGCGRGWSESASACVCVARRVCSCECGRVSARRGEGPK